MRFALVASAVFLLPLLAGCGQDRPGAPLHECPDGTDWLEPGCDPTSDPSDGVSDFAPGCYANCAAGCAAGASCVKVWGDPCANPQRGKPNCLECGGTRHICLSR